MSGLGRLCLLVSYSRVVYFPSLIRSGFLLLDVVVTFFLESPLQHCSNFFSLIFFGNSIQENMSLIYLSSTRLINLVKAAGKILNTG